MLETKQIDGEDALNICREMMDTHTSEITRCFNTQKKITFHFRSVIFYRTYLFFIEMTHGAQCGCLYDCNRFATGKYRLHS